MIFSLRRWFYNSRKYEDVRHPYPALSSYADTDLDRSLFFGRKQEIENLLSQVLTSDLVLLFGRSGYGKTSLINAGVMEPLREQHYFPVVCQLTHSLAETPLECIRARMLEAAEAEGVEVVSPEGCRSLWEFFYRSTFTKKKHRLRPVLVLDQFEELFSRIAVEPQWGPGWKQRFVQELSDLVRRRVPESLKDTYIQEVESLPVESEDRRRLVDCLYGSGGPDVKVLIAIREDWLAELEALRPYIPAIFSNAVRLEPLTAECARLAITQPAEHAALVGMEPFTFETSALDEMIAFLSTDKRTGKPRAGACIEPAQLQILCYDLSVRRLRRGATTITARDLRGPHGMRRIIKVFYYRILHRFPRLRFGWSARRFWPSLTNFLLFHRPRRSIRRMCEYGLITASGYRNSVILDSIQRRFGVSKGDLDRLVNLRLLRAEPRLGTVFYELVHDTLVEPLRVIRRNRRLLRLVMIVGVVLTPWAIFGLISAFENFMERREIRMATNILNSAEASVEDRSDAFRTLAQGRVDFIKADLKGLDLDNVRVSYAMFDGAKLNGANLEGAYFSRVHFVGTDLRDVQAQGATFSNSDFEGAMVEGMIIKDTRFHGTNWWMAIGWSDEQLNHLKRRYPLTTYIQAPTYRQRISALTGRVRTTTGKERADLLNDLAWYRAVNGADLLAAYAEITEAIKTGGPTNRFHYLDTRAYIRLQLSEFTAAAADLEQATALVSKQQEKGEPHPAEGPIWYHMGLAYEGTKHMDKANRAYARAKMLGYKPSYERVLTPRRGGQPTIRRPRPSPASEYLRLLSN